VATIAPAPVEEDAELERLASGREFLEGPVWVERDGGYLLCSDIPRNQILQWRPGNTGFTVWRDPSNHTNGNTLDLQGRLISCEHGSRTVTRTAWGEEPETIAERHDGRLLNSPNDVAVRSDGTLWFTDPIYGLEDREAEQQAEHVFRLDPASGEVVAVLSELQRPNGICFSPDGNTLYVAESGKSGHLLAFDVRADGRLESRRIFYEVVPRGPDGIRCDEHGRVWTTAGDGVHVVDPSGELVGRIEIPEKPANLCFGGHDGRTLFVTARTSLYAIRVTARDARYPLSRTPASLPSRLLGCLAADDVETALGLANLSDRVTEKRFRAEFERGAEVFASTPWQWRSVAERVHGDVAFVILEETPASGEKVHFAMELLRVDGDWRLDTFHGFAASETLTASQKLAIQRLLGWAEKTISELEK
jgi:gluconolactonase